MAPHYRKFAVMKRSMHAGFVKMSEYSDDKVMKESVFCIKRRLIFSFFAEGGHPR